MKVRKLSSLVALALVHAVFIAALAIAALAQITMTGIRGIVRDPNGAVVPNATVKATDNGTGVEQTTISSSDGGFIFPALQFGSYKLAVTAAGFQNSVIAAVVVESGGFSNTSLISGIASIATITTSGTTRTSQVNPSLYAPASTPGQFASYVFLRNNNLYTLDMSVNKEVRFTERWRLTLRLVALNFLNHPFFDLPIAANQSPTSTAFGQNTTASGTRTMQFRASLDW